MEKLQDKIKEISNEAIKAVVRTCAEYGTFTPDEPVELFDCSILSQDTFYMTSITLSEDTEDAIDIKGYTENHYGGSKEDTSFVLDALNVEQVVTLADYLNKYREENPYASPAAFVGTSDWADHYDGEIKERWEALSAAYNVK